MKNLRSKLMKRQLVPAVIVGAVYLVAYMILIVVTDANGRIDYKISPYDHGSDVVDFFFGLIVTVPFSIFTFFMKKDGFLEYASVRTSKKNYVMTCFQASMAVCFLMVFLVNIIAVIFSCCVATIDPSGPQKSLALYVLGYMQMSEPILFGVIWSLHKAFVGALICLFAQIIALYVDNLFLALCGPYVYLMLENFVTGVLRIPRFSIWTVFALNRLSPDAMTVFYSGFSLLVFMAIIRLTYVTLNRRCEKPL